MNRRTVIRNVLLVSVGTALLPSCMQDKKSTLTLRHLSLTESQEQMLAALTAAILPSDKNFVGAAELKAHEFVLTMIDDCTSPDDQQQFSKGMEAFDKFSSKAAGQSFVKSTAMQQQQLLATLEKKQNVPEEVLHFYQAVKHYTLQCFTSSKPYMTDIQHYKMVPGPNFKGCVAV